MEKGLSENFQVLYNYLSYEEVKQRSFQIQKVDLFHVGNFSLCVSVYPIDQCTRNGGLMNKQWLDAFNVRVYQLLHSIHTQGLNVLVEKWIDTSEEWFLATCKRLLMSPD